MYSNTPYDNPPTTQNDKPVTHSITSLHMYLLHLQPTLFAFPLRCLLGQHSLDADLKILRPDEVALRPSLQL